MLRFPRLISHHFILDGVSVLRPELYRQQDSHRGIMVTVIVRFTDNYSGRDGHSRRYQTNDRERERRGRDRDQQEPYLQNLRPH